VALVLSGANDISKMILNSADPGSTMMVFIGTLTLSFAIGATFTGLIFKLQDRM
jgi:hypothetical protein